MIFNVNDIVNENVETNEIVNQFEYLHFVIDEIVIFNHFDETIVSNVLSLNNDFVIVIDHIHAILSLNELQKFLIENILNHVIMCQKKFCIKRKNQFLLYIRNENEIEKNRVVKTLKLKFFFLKKRKKLIFIAFTKCAIDNIKNNIIHTFLNFSIFFKNFKKRLHKI